MQEPNVISHAGKPIGLSREPVPRPEEIKRGVLVAPTRFTQAMTEEDARITFSKTVPGFVLTYHDVQIIGADTDGLAVFVGPHDVVTWEQV